MKLRSQAGYEVASIEFQNPPTRLTAERTAEGFKIRLPVNLGLTAKPANQKNPPMKIPMLANIRGFIHSAVRSSMELGQITCEQNRFMWPIEHAPAWLEWRGTLAALGQYEQLRQDHLPQFEIGLWADISVIIRDTEEGIDKLFTVPETSFEKEHITYPLEAWAGVLRTLGVSDILVLEIPLSSESPPGWEKVWTEVSIAKAELERGGKTAWRGCGLAVRRALEEWRAIEKETEPGQKLLRDRSKQERFDDLRRYLKNYADRPQHTGIEECSREDAKLMLTVLTALLSASNP